VILLPRTYWRRRSRIDLVLQWLRSGWRSTWSQLNRLVPTSGARKRSLDPLPAGRQKRH